MPVEAGRGRRGRRVVTTTENEVVNNNTTTMNQQSSPTYLLQLQLGTPSHVGVRGQGRDYATPDSLCIHPGRLRYTGTS